jgi:hypothetical protein
MKAKGPGLTLAVVRHLRDARAVTRAEDLDAFEAPRHARLPPDQGRRNRLRALAGNQPRRRHPAAALLLTVLFGADLPSGRLAEIPGDREHGHRERLAYYRALDAELVRSGAGPYARATLDFGIRYEEAVLRWFADLPPEVRQLQGGGQPDPQADPSRLG